MLLVSGTPGQQNRKRTLGHRTASDAGEGGLFYTLRARTGPVSPPRITSFPSVSSAAQGAEMWGDRLLKAVC